MDERSTHVSYVDDPTIWKVKCMVGRERHSAFCLMQKYIDLKALGTKLQIIFAFAVEHVKGFIYIEAKKQSDIQEVRNIGMIDVRCVPDKTSFTEVNLTENGILRLASIFEVLTFSTKLEWWEEIVGLKISRIKNQDVKIAASARGPHRFRKRLNTKVQMVIPNSIVVAESTNF
ncbi:hypothetical protein L1887_25429 [Cichorium endivia]|nr:hypothetical protein L1887_25429 [Cichorium endivia]